jgi:hypothetical protein
MAEVLNATMTKTAHIEIIAETSKRLRGFSLAKHDLLPVARRQLVESAAWTDWNVRERSDYVLEKPELI